jgi:hypothetical protein
MVVQEQPPEGGLRWSWASGSHMCLAEARQKSLKAFNYTCRSFSITLLSTQSVKIRNPKK